MYVIKNKTKFQINLGLSKNADPDKIIIIPPKGYRDYDLTDEEAMYVKQNYKKEIILKVKA